MSSLLSLAEFYLTKGDVPCLGFCSTALKRSRSSTVVGAFPPNYSILVHVSSDRNCHTLMGRVWSSACLFIPGQGILLLKQCEKLHLFHKQMPTLLQRANSTDQQKYR